MSPDERAELVTLAEDLLLDVLRDEPLIPFQREHLRKHVDQRWAKSNEAGVGLAEADTRAIFTEACERLHTRLPSIEAKPYNFMNSDGFCGVRLHLRPEREWVDVLRELHGPSVKDPARELTYSAAQLLDRIESGEFTRGFLSAQSVRHRIRRFGYHGLEDIIKELEVKRGLKLKLERKEDPAAKVRRELLKFQVIERPETPPPLIPEAPNPVFRYSGERAGIHLAFRRFLQEQLLKLEPSGSDRVRLWAFGSLKALQTSFPGAGTDRSKYSGYLVDLLHGCVVHPDVALYWSLDYHTFAWTVGCTVSRPWTDVLPKVAEALREPDVVERYPMSAEAANLLRWVLNLPKSSLLMSCTPVVEQAIRERQLRLGADWPSDNLPALIEVLCDEVSQQTPYVLKPLAWKSSYYGGQVETRVRLTKAAPPSDMTDMVLRWLESRGVQRTAAEVRLALEKLSNGSPVAGEG